MSVGQTTVKERLSRGKAQAIWATIKLLYQMDARAFLMSTLTGAIQSLFYPLLLLIVWKGFFLLTASGGQIHDVSRQGIMLLVGLFVLLALQHLLRIANETATNILQAVSSQHINARMMSKMSEIPYQLFEENDFQARYGLVISQASYRPGMLAQTFIGSLSALVSLLAIAATLSALAPLFIVLLLVLVPLTIVETRFHRD